jgi:glycosyltransferase involved in cell wall biosynthesis
LRVVRHESNRGYGGALITGFATATRDWIFYTDGDAQYDAHEVASLVSAINDGTDIAQGYKITRGDAWYRVVIGRAYHYTVKVLFALPVRDTDCDFRLFRRRLLDQAPLQSTSGVICVEMMRKFHRAGARFVEVPVHHYSRPHGRSQFFRLPQITRSALQLLTLWYRLMLRSRSDARRT